MSSMGMSVARSNGLTLYQRRAAVMLAAGQSSQDVAAAIGVTERSVLAWQSEEDMQREIERIMKPAADDAVAIVQRLLPAAEATLAALIGGRQPPCEDGEPANIPASVQGAMALGVVKMAHGSRVEVSGPAGGPVQVEGIPLHLLSTDQLEAYGRGLGVESDVIDAEEDDS